MKIIRGVIEYIIPPPYTHSTTPSRCALCNAKVASFFTIYKLLLSYNILKITLHCAMLWKYPCFFFYFMIYLFFCILLIWYLWKICFGENLSFLYIFVYYNVLYRVTNSIKVQTKGQLRFVGEMIFQSNNVFLIWRYFVYVYVSFQRSRYHYLKLSYSI